MTTSTKPIVWTSSILLQSTTDRVVANFRGLVQEWRAPTTVGKRGGVTNKTNAERKADHRAMYAVARLMADVLMIRPNPGGWTAQALVERMYTEVTREEADRG